MSALDFNTGRFTLQKRLQLLVKQSADNGEIEKLQEIIKNAFDFTDHTAKQVMVPTSSKYYFY